MPLLCRLTYLATAQLHLEKEVDISYSTAPEVWILSICLSTFLPLQASSLQALEHFDTCKPWTVLQLEQGEILKPLKSQILACTLGSI